MNILYEYRVIKRRGAGYYRPQVQLVKGYLTDEWRPVGKSAHPTLWGAKKKCREHDRNQKEFMAAPVLIWESNPA